MTDKNDIHSLVDALKNLVVDFHMVMTPEEIDKTERQLGKTFTEGRLKSAFCFIFN